MWFFGTGRGTGLLAKVKALQRHKEVAERLTQLYGILTILDQKATGL